MKLSEHKELKAEILSLSPKEKDKLLLRLVAKDKVLTERLHFLLLEDEGSLSDRVATIKEEIEYTNKGLTIAKDVLLNLRKLIKLINHFLKVTKANFEEVELRIFLLNNTPTSVHSSFRNYKNYEQVFAVFFVKSVLATLRKFEKLHEDLQFDLREDLNNLLNKVHSKSMVSIASELGLPKQI